MFNKKEIAIVLGITLVLAISLSFLRSLDRLLYLVPVFLIIILVNVLAKKMVSEYLDSEIELGVWKMKRYGFKPERRLKKDLPAGILFPLIFSVLTLGNLVWLASIVFDVKPKVHRAARRHGLYKFSEMTEDHIGLIAAAGIFANVIFAIIGYLIGFEIFAKFNIYYAFFNILPFSDLDGNKIFFGNLALWSLLAAIVLIGVGAALLLV